jgi:hypothetical protein
MLQGRDAYRCYVGGRGFRPVEDFPDHGHGRLPPILGIGLRPSRSRVIGVDLAVGLSNDPSLEVVQHCPRGGGALINGQQAWSHVSVPVLSALCTLGENDHLESLLSNDDVESLRCLRQRQPVTDKRLHLDQAVL